MRHGRFILAAIDRSGKDRGEIAAEIGISRRHLRRLCQDASTPHPYERLLEILEIPESTATTLAEYNCPPALVEFVSAFHQALLPTIAEISADHPDFFTAENASDCACKLSSFVATNARKKSSCNSRAA